MVRQSDRAFGLMFTGVFAVIFVVGWFVFDKRLDWAAYVAAAFLLVALIRPTLLMPLNRIWMGFAHRLSGVSNRIVLGLFFFGILTPFGFILKLFSRDPMTRNNNPDTLTFWQPVKRQLSKDTLSDMF